MWSKRITAGKGVGMDGRWTEERANAKALWQEGAWHIKERKDNVAGEQGVRQKVVK